MALAIDGSSPGVVTGTSAGAITTASFTPPANSLILIGWAGDSGTGVNPSQPTITDSLGGHLTYNLIGFQSHASSPTVNGQTAMWWATNPSATAMTISTTNNDTSFHEQALKVWVFTGADTTGVGANGKNGSASAASIAQSYTAQATGGWGVIAVCDWDLKGAETAGTGCTSDGSANVSTAITYAFMRRTSADDTNGSNNTLNVTLPGTSANLGWVYAEVKPAASGSSFDAQVSVTRQQSSVTRVGPVVVTPTIGPPQVIQLPQITVVPYVKQPPAPFPAALTPGLLPPQAPQPAPIVVAAQSRIPPSPPVSVSPAQLPATTLLPLATTVVAQQFRPTTVAPVVATPPPLPPTAQPASVVVAAQQFRPPVVLPAAYTPTLLPSGTPALPPAPIWVNPSQTQPPLSATIALIPAPLPQATAPIVVVTSTWQPRQPQIVVSQPPPVAAILPAAPILVAAAFVRLGFLPTSVSPPPFLGPSALPPAPILVVPTFTRFRLAPVFVAAGTAAAHDCDTHRPNTGITARPGSGTTVYALATTARPNSGTTTRPNSGVTEPPCN